MMDAEWFVEQLEDAIELVAEKIKGSKPTNPQMWYLLQAQSMLLRDYWDHLKAPSHHILGELQGKLNALEAQVKLLGAKGQLETIQIGKTRLGGAQ